MPNPLPLTVNGRVHGGQQAVVGATIQLYVAGNAGNGSASTSLLNTSVVSGQDGGFSITGDYSCPSPTSQVYLVATQGNPGLGSGGNNPALAMMAALGNCGNLSPTQFIWIDEVTTVAAGWALAPFAQDIAHIGSSSTNSVGLANAFLDAQLIADTTQGKAATLPSNLTTEPGKIYALADALASCINSDGTTGCSPLFTAATPSGGSAPTNTWEALMNIVKNPGNNVSGVFSAIGPQPPFATTLSQPPHDWTLSLTVTGGGVNTPEGLGVDSQGNVWVSNHSGIVSAFNPQGTVLSASGFGFANATEAYGLAIDPADNVWITVGETPSHSGTKGSVEKFSGASSGGTLGTMTTYADNSINYPYAIAIDSGNGNILIANYYVKGTSTNLVILNPATSTYIPVNMGGDVGVPVAVAPDAAHGVWMSSGNGIGTAAHVDAGGNITFSSECCGATDGVAVDSAGNVWLADSTDSDEAGDSGGAVTELGADGSTIHEFITTGGISNPSHIAIDAAQNVWIANFHAPPDSGFTYESFSELSGVNSSSPGTALSPSTGYGLDAKLLSPFSMVVDPSGNLWLSNTGANSLVMFFGMATPTKTPMPTTPVAP
ncbi:MAG TPA: hypothetical protein VFW30_12470 [Bryocella sp.]|nr:hypothetical protein [Bryocella sp.]